MTKRVGIGNERGRSRRRRGKRRRGRGEREGTRWRETAETEGRHICAHWA